MFNNTYLGAKAVSGRCFRCQATGPYPAENGGLVPPARSFCHHGRPGFWGGRGGYIWDVKIPSLSLIGIEIDKLTNSIENAVTGEAFETTVLPVPAAGLKTTTKKNGWLFNWREEARQPGHQVFKLTTDDNPNVVQGLISLEIMVDHVYMHLIESAPFNLGKRKMYVGVPGNLVAHACKVAFEHGHEGYVSFVSKTSLVGHYAATLGAKLIGGRTMIIDTAAALKLTSQYFSKQAHEKDPTHRL